MIKFMIPFLSFQGDKTKEISPLPSFLSSLPTLFFFLSLLPPLQQTQANYKLFMSANE